MRDVEKVKFDNSFASVKPKSFDSWFWGFEKVTSFDGLGNLDTSDATTMESMFYACSAIKSINVSTFDMSKVETVKNMFWGCDNLNDITSMDGEVEFIGNYSPVTLTGSDKSNLYLGSGNKLYIASADRIMNSFRAYFHVNLGTSLIKHFSLNFGKDETVTGIFGIEDEQSSMVNDQWSMPCEGWYTLQGIKLEAEPTQPGIYIKDGVKVIK